MRLTSVMLRLLVAAASAAAIPVNNLCKSAETCDSCQKGYVVMYSYGKCTCQPCELYCDGSPNDCPVCCLAEESRTSSTSLTTQSSTLPTTQNAASTSTTNTNLATGSDNSSDAIASNVLAIALGVSFLVAVVLISVLVTFCCWIHIPIPIPSCLKKNETPVTLPQEQPDQAAPLVARGNADDTVGTQNMTAANSTNPLPSAGSQSASSIGLGDSSNTLQECQDSGNATISAATSKKVSSASSAAVLTARPPEHSTTAQQTILTVQILGPTYDSMQFVVNSSTDVDSSNGSEILREVGTPGDEQARP